MINPLADYKVKPFGFSWRSSTLFIITTIGMGIFSDLFLYGLIVPILPHILLDRIHVAPEQVQSYTSALLTSYAASSFVVSPLAGILADRSASRQMPFLFGLTLLIVSTLALFAGTTIPVLLAARVFQGASSAFVWTVGLALCIDTVGPENLGKVIGSIFSVVSIGALMAPVIGGLVYEKASYAAVGILALSLLVIDFVMRVLVIEKKVAQRYNEADPDYHSVPDSDRDESDENAHNGTHDGIDQETPLLSEQSDPSAYFIPPSVPSWYHRAPIFYPFLHSPSLIAACIVSFVQAVLLGAFDATVATHAADLFSFDAMHAGLLYVPLGVVNLIVGPLAGWCVDRYGVKVVAVTGFTLITPALALLRLPHAANPERPQIILYAALLAFSGAGLAIIDAPGIVEAGAVIDRYHRRNPGFFGEQGPYAQLYGITSMVFSAGLSVGPELAGELTRSIGYGNMSAVLACVSAASAISSFLWLGGKPAVFARRKSTTYL